MQRLLLAQLVTLASLSMLAACGGEPTTPAPTPAPEEAQPEPAPPPPPAKADAPPNPCDTPGKQTVALSAGVTRTTPWGLELSYALDPDKKRGDGYMFLLKHGARRWQTRRDDSNWNTEMTWRGFCWRGGERPEKRASSLEIEMAPVCKESKLVELGGCGDALSR